MSDDTHPAPVATCRVQFTPAFGFDAAAAQAEYWAELGVSHVYCSPYLQAAPGSTSGYDVTSHERVNAELGGPEAQERFVRALSRHGLAQVLDIVPNHMHVGQGHNPLWMDVLEHGPASRYARFFDIDWQPPQPSLRGRVLLPVLGQPLGQAVQAGQVRLEREGGRFTVRYMDHVAPAAPESLRALLADAALRAGSDELACLARAAAALATGPASIHAQTRARDWAVLQGWLAGQLDARPALAEAIDRAIEVLNADPARLLDLLDRQHYRLAWWRSAGREINYRRFFEIDALVGLRVEREEVFDASHRLILDWVDRGEVAGLRVDHIDGLCDPQAYLDRLRGRAPHAWLLVEKILGPGEWLPPSWPVAGTTGYEFANLVGGLFVDPAAKAPLTALYEEFTGLEDDWEAIALAGKQLVLEQSFGGELDRLTELLWAIASALPDHRDHGRRQLREALCALTNGFAVYRSYLRPGHGPAHTQQIAPIDHALENAQARRSDLDAGVWTLLRSLLTLQRPGPREAEFVLRFQQLTGPAMAKGVEDTAFYRYHRLVSLNEVGGDPGRFGTWPEQFHHWCAHVASHWPLTLRTLSTHDTKRGEDTRLRIHLLSEAPDAWAAAVADWAQRAQAHGADALADRNAEYLLYQTLVGTWPIEPDRLMAYMLKAIREAKLRTSWTDPDADYEDALRRLVENLLGDRAFTEAVGAFVADLLPAARVHSLAQTLIHCTAPGVPDIYQGSELWNESLVDPDNRRPVDYARLRALLRVARSAGAAEAMARTDQGLPKVYLLQRALEVRRQRPAAFGPQGGYEPVRARGGRAGHVVAFLRGGQVLTVAPRLVRSLGEGWGDTAVDLPPGAAWRDVLTGRAARGCIEVGPWLEGFPVALLVKED